MLLLQDFIKFSFHRFSSGVKNCVQAPHLLLWCSCCTDCTVHFSSNHFPGLETICYLHYWINSLYELFSVFIHKVSTYNGEKEIQTFQIFINYFIININIYILNSDTVFIKLLSDSDHTGPELDKAWTNSLSLNHLCFASLLDPLKKKKRKFLS